MKIGKFLKKSVSKIGGGIGDGGRRLSCGLLNLRRRIFHKRLADYSLFVLENELSERAPQKPWWWSYLPNQTQPTTLEYLSDALHTIAGDPSVKGVVFLFKSPTLTVAQAQNLSALFSRFHEWDKQYNGESTKEIVAHLEQINPAVYVAACGADKITTTALTSWDIFGLRFSVLFLKDTLARAGIKMDVIKIAPWKSAVDNLTRTEMSDAARDQYNWLLDSLYDDVIEAVSQGRGLETDQVRALIDQAPLTAADMVEAGLADDILYEDEMAHWLGSAKADTEETPAETDAISIKPYDKVSKLLMRHPRRRASQAIGVISLAGTIMTGKSRSYPVELPLFGDETMGSSTVQQQIRAARENDMVAAIVLHVDSGGGSALASDLMWRELKLLDQEKPVVVYMGNVAASGGYYIATPGRKIVAQSATLTGSIGVVSAKPVTSETYAKVGANPEIIERGKNAGIYDSNAEWSEEQRTLLTEKGIHYIYREFKERVAESRGLDYDGLDDICYGRVWTGKQALEHNLIDAVGDFQVAVDMACELAELPTDGTVQTMTIADKDDYKMARPVEAVQEILGIGKASQWTDLTEEVVQMLVNGDVSTMLRHEPYWLLTDIRLK